MRATRALTEDTAWRDTPVRVGLIGAGSIARAHAIAYVSARTYGGPEVPQVRLVTVADVDGAVAKETRRSLHEAAIGALRSSAVRDAFSQAGARLNPSASPEEFAEDLRAEMAQWRTLRAEIGLATAG